MFARMECPLGPFYVHDMESKAVRLSTSSARDVKVKAIVKQVIPTSKSKCLSSNFLSDRCLDDLFCSLVVNKTMTKKSQVHMSCRKEHPGVFSKRVESLH